MFSQDRLLSVKIFEFPNSADRKRSEVIVFPFSSISCMIKPVKEHKITRQNIQKQICILKDCTHNRVLIPLPQERFEVDSLNGLPEQGNCWCISNAFSREHPLLIVFSRLFPLKLTKNFTLVLQSHISFSCVIPNPLRKQFKLVLTMAAINNERIPNTDSSSHLLHQKSTLHRGNTICLGRKFLIPHKYSA